MDVLRELRDIALADLSQAYNEKGELKPLSEIPANVRKAIGSIDCYENFLDGVEVGVTKRVKFIDKTKALDMAGRHFKMFTDKSEVKSEVELTSSLAKPVLEELKNLFNALKDERKG